MATTNEMIMTATGSYRSAREIDAETTRNEIRELTLEIRQVPVTFRTGGTAAADTIRPKAELVS